MIVHYRFKITDGTENRIPSWWAYRTYAWLLAQLPQDAADALHTSIEKPVSQAIWYDQETSSNFWEVNLYTEQMILLLNPILMQLKQVVLHAVVLSVHLLEKKCADGATLLATAAEQQTRQAHRINLCFLTPTAFRQQGRYTIFPSINLLLQSLSTKWNFFFPAYSMEDEGAFQMMGQKLFIVDYSLRTTRYPLKDTKIPGFYGSIVIESQLPAPLESLWLTLVALTDYTGVGIKPALGMGLVKMHANHTGQRL